MSQAYQQLVLDDDSKGIVTINTHKGLFSYQRLPFGVSSAPGTFQRTMETILAGVPRVLVYLDDIIVTEASQEEHMSNLKQVFVTTTRSWTPPYVKINVSLWYLL